MKPEVVSKMGGVNLQITTRKRNKKTDALWKRLIFSL